MRKTPIFIVLAGIIALIVLLCTHTVKEWEQALVLEFGQAKRVENAWGADPAAGLKLKLPYETVITLDRRNLEVDLQKVELVASDQERLVVDAFIRYRIVDGVSFYQALQSERGAQLQLQSIMDSTLRDVLGRVD
ncbi:MAG: SPFH domain-containing protein, partial [Litorimonas sp.]